MNDELSIPEFESFARPQARKTRPRTPTPHPLGRVVSFLLTVAGLVGSAATVLFAASLVYVLLWMGNFLGAILGS